MKSNANIMVTSKVLDPKYSSKGTSKLVDEKSEPPFVCLALMSFTPKNRLKKRKYMFDLTLCDDIFDSLLEHNFLKIFLSQRHTITWETWKSECIANDNSFDHSTKNCNTFCLIVQSTIDKGRLSFADAHEDDKLASIGHDDEILSN
jgi:hypothetical protein